MSNKSELIREKLEEIKSRHDSEEDGESVKEMRAYLANNKKSEGEEDGEEDGEENSSAMMPSYDTSSNTNEKPQVIKNYFEELNKQNEANNKQITEQMNTQSALHQLNNNEEKEEEMER